MVEQQTNARLERLQLLRNFSKKVFNYRVNQAYAGEDEFNTLARKVLTIEDNDTIDLMNYKLDLFYLGLDKLAPSHQQFLSLSGGNKRLMKEFKEGKRTRRKETRLNSTESQLLDEDGTVTLHFRATKKFYADGKRTGYIYLDVPHVDLKKVDKLRELVFKVGIKRILYSFADGRQIKVDTNSKKAGHALINQILECVQPSWFAGKSESHSYFGEFPEDIERPKLDGQTMYVFKVSWTSPDGKNKYVLF
jgi:hypothetical protein